MATVRELLITHSILDEGNSTRDHLNNLFSGTPIKVHGIDVEIQADIYLAQVNDDRINIVIEDDPVIEIAVDPFDVETQKNIKVEI